MAQRLIVLLFVALVSMKSFAAELPDYAELYSAHSDSVVTVHTLSSSAGSTQPRSGLGSGVLIDEDRILTANHVIDSAQLIRVQFNDGVQIPAVVVASLEASDIALLKLDRPHPSPVIATMADSDATRVGEPVFIIGSPFGISQTLSIGHLSGRLDKGMLAGGSPIEFLQTDTAINTGNSGGPMFNTAGEVIGIVSFILSKGGGFDGIGFATSSNTAKTALLDSSGILAGFEGIFLDEQLTRLLNVPESGLLVQRVVKGSIAEKAGLRAGTTPSRIGQKDIRLGGDVILEINGLVCVTPHDFKAISEQSTLSLSAENTYELKVFREGQEIELIAGAPLDELSSLHLD